MLPDHGRITSFEETLANVAEGFGGRNGGWGCVTQPKIQWCFDRLLRLID